MRAIVAVILLAALAGCATKSPEELAFEKVKKDAYCAQYAEPGTPAFEGCHQSIARAEHQEKMERVAEAIDDMAEQQRANQPITTNCNRFGNSVNCRTY